LMFFVPEFRREFQRLDGKFGRGYNLAK